MNHPIVALVGMCGSGKSVVTEFFTAEGYTSIHFGGVTQAELRRRGMTVCEANERSIREELRREMGLGAYAIILYPEILEASEKGPVVLDGLYSWSELKYLRERLGDRLTVVAVVTGAGTRRARLATRTVRPLTAAEMDSRDTSEIENLEKGGPIAAADYYLTNEGTLEELRAQYDGLKANF